MRIYDTLTQEKKPFQPREPGKAGIYVCGPTTYDYSHIGHARCYVVSDVLVRHLRDSGWDVKFVRNVTDVDDKIIKRAKERDEDPLALSERFYEAYAEDMARLGNLTPDIEPKVSGHIQEVIALVQRLVDKGYA
jgi:cysteinyl-tRNA synthetase